MSEEPRSEVELRAEARAAWDLEGRRSALPSLPEATLSAAVAVVGAGTVVAVGARLAMLFATRPAALAGVIAVSALLTGLLVLGPALAWRRGARRARALADEASRRRRNVVCPRCHAPILARGEEEAGARECGSCGATLLEALGLVVHDIRDPRWRALRWRAAARSRLGAAGDERSISLSPRAWLAATVLSLGALWATGAAVGGDLPPRTLEAPLGRAREIPHHGIALAQGEARALPAGPTTRPRAPEWEGTMVLARMDGGALHRLGVIVRVRDRRAFVVYADGDSEWLGRADLLSPEIADGDAVLMEDGSALVDATVIGRVGPAIELRLADGRTVWTNASVVRIRSDGAHQRGRGAHSPIPPGAWVEAHAGAGVWRPGIAVGSDPSGLLIAFSDGTERWVRRDETRAQALDPGARVWVDGRGAEAIVAARIGDALVVVDPDGTRSWTALSRVRRALRP